MEYVDACNFIPTQSIGLIGKVDRAIVRKALRYLAGLPQELSGVGISINLSGMSVGDDEVFTLIESELKRPYQSAAHHFEVTETPLRTDGQGRGIHRRIRQLGCQISLDDFAWVSPRSPI